MKKMRYLLVFICIMVVLFFGFTIVAICSEHDTFTGAQCLEMTATAYCYGSTRMDGQPVRTGICAAKPEWYGRTVAIYENDNGVIGKFIGYYECLDTGGKAIRNGKNIDIYNPSYDWCMNFGRKKVFVFLFETKG